MLLYRYEKQNTPFFWLLSQILLCGLGYGAAWQQDIRNDRQWMGHHMGNAQGYLACIAAEPEAKQPQRYKLCVNMLAVKQQGGNLHPVSGTALVYALANNFPMLLHRGDTVWLPPNWQPIRNGGNPYEFDYAGWCAHNNIYYRQTCSLRAIRLHSPQAPEALSFILRAHDWCIGRLNEYITDKQARGLIQAMLLGDEVNLDDDLRAAYADTGIVHIIAISGGNVMLLFSMFAALLWWIRHKRFHWIRYAAALPLVWVYVLMAGASPSAVRAALMFSLLAGGIFLGRRQNPLNQLLGTAMLLLFAEPSWLYAVGFQLSFVAVLSLILFYKPVYGWWQPGNKIARQIWGAAAASIAAEILVAPLVVFYFHNFPLMFIVANVAALLFMGIVLWLGVIIVLLSFVPPVAIAAAYVLSWLVAVFLSVVHLLQQCNPEALRHLYLSAPAMWCLYIVIASWSLFLLRKNKPALWIGLGSIVLLLLADVAMRWRSQDREVLVVYNVRGGCFAELYRQGHYHTLPCDSPLQSKAGYMANAARTGFHAWRKPVTPLPVFFNVGNRRVLVLHSGDSWQTTADYVLVADKVKAANIIDMYKKYRPKGIIIPSIYKADELEEITGAAREGNIPLVSIADGGAFVLEEYP